MTPLSSVDILAEPPPIPVAGIAFRLIGITCEAVVSEAWFLLRHLPRHLRRLRGMLTEGVFDLSFHLEKEGAAVSHLMDRFEDVPMALADACLVRLSELHPRLPLLTLDSDFKVYRRQGRQMIPVISPR